MIRNAVAMSCENSTGGRWQSVSVPRWKRPRVSKAFPGHALPPATLTSWQPRDPRHEPRTASVGCCGLEDALVAEPLLAPGGPGGGGLGAGAEAETVSAGGVDVEVGRHSGTL